jgi:hypothetical protein
MTDTNTNDPSYTVQVNNKEYEVNNEAREAIQTRASHEYSENPMFSCFWKTAHPSQYADDEWENTIHETGDPVLVIETEGPMVPWERMDKLNVEMQEVGPESQLDRQMDDDADKDDIDNGNGLKTIDPDDVDGAEKEIGRTHFGLTPQSFEEVPSPDGEEPEKIPPKPERLGDEPSLVAWVPDHPEVEHSWSAGEAICPMYNRVEWNVQVKANQPRLNKDKDTSHDHWESLLKSHDCDKVAELQPTQTPQSDQQSGQVERKGKDRFENGTAGGNNWQV